MIPVKTLSDGFSLPEIGIGTAYIGGNKIADYSQDDNAVKSMKKAISYGLTHIDTSELYGAGHAEELVKIATDGFDRKDLFISTKVLKTNLDRHSIVRSAKASMLRLGVGYIDLYSIHMPSFDVPLKESMSALDELVAEGLVRHIGVSNFTVELMREAQSLTKNKIVCNQFEFNLSVRERSQFHKLKRMESEIIPYCQNNDVLIVAACPIDRGGLLKPNQIMDALSAKYNRTYAQIAINWLLCQKNVVTLTRSVNRQHFQENMGAIGWRMDDKDFRLLTHKYPSDRGWRKWLK